MRRDLLRRSILEVLADFGGSARVRDVMDAVEKKLGRQLGAEDRQEVNRERRWKIDARFERLNMVRAGLLKNGSPRGQWEMTEEGRRYLKAH